MILSRAEILIWFPFVKFQARHSLGNPALLPGQQIQQQMQQQQQQQQLYDQVRHPIKYSTWVRRPNSYFFRPQVNGENSYDAVAGGGQNFGNPYDCPEGMYGGSMVSSVGYSKVSDYSGVPQFRGPAMAPQQPPMPPQHAMGPGAQAMQNSFPGDTGTVIYKGGPEPQPIIQGVPGVQQQQQQPMQPQPMQVQMPPQTQVSIPKMS